MSRAAASLLVRLTLAAFGGDAGLHQGVDTYLGHKDVGGFLKTILDPGSTRPWREVLQRSTGRTLDAKAIVADFAPLEAWLREQYKGRSATLPPL